MTKKGGIRRIGMTASGMIPRRRMEAIGFAT